MRTQGTLTLNNTGLQTFNLEFSSAPTWAHLTVCEKYTGDNVAHLSIGKVNTTPSGIRQFCQSTFADPSGSDSFNSNAHVVQHYERFNGNITKMLSASFDSFTTTGIKLNVDIAHGGYQVLVEAGN